jgi:uncharacterized Zn finger protein
MLQSRPDIVDRKNNEAYKDAARLLKKIQALMQRVGQGAAFQAYLAAVRTAHKPKRNFIALLEPVWKEVAR